VSNIIPYQTLVRQQHLSYLKHQSKEYREREDYLLRLRRLLFQVEAQLRQAEMQQLEAFQQIADHFQIPLRFPDLGDRLGLQEFFRTDPLLLILQDFFAGRLSAEECLQRLSALTSPPA
jgi:hypothetical protein